MSNGDKFRVLMVHNYYKHAGGEDQVFAAEAALLRRQGHDVETYTLHNGDIEAMGRMELASSTVWNRRSFNGIRDAAARLKAHVVHFHNTLPLVSPAGYYGAREAGAAVVQTLHNYRLACASAQLMRDNRPCEDCVGKHFPWPAVWHRCYRSDRAASAVLAVMLSGHRYAGTWRNAVDRYIALTPFARDKMVQAGLPPEKLAVKPNFVEPDPGMGTGRGGFALFAGRLSPEKGIETLVEAWQDHRTPVPLKIAGDGPLAGPVRSLAERSEQVEWLGALSRDRLLPLFRDAAMLIVPSYWYEGFPMVVAEAFATGLPVVASRLGGLASVIEDERTGVLVPPGDPAALSEAVSRLFAQPERRAAMRKAVRDQYAKRFTAAINYDRLMGVYRDATSIQASHAA